MQIFDRHLLTLNLLPGGSGHQPAGTTTGPRGARCKCRTRPAPPGAAVGLCAFRRSASFFFRPCAALIVTNRPHRRKSLTKITRGEVLADAVGITRAQTASRERIFFSPPYSGRACARPGASSCGEGLGVGVGRYAAASTISNNLRHPHPGSLRSPSLPTRGREKCEPRRETVFVRHCRT